MEIIYNPLVFKHNTQEEHAEGPYRIEGIGRIARDVEVDFDVLPYLKRVHPQRYIQKIKRHCLSEMLLAETQASKDTFNAALISAGLAVIASKEQAFAATRPPGHHAGKERAAGFCFFNNIAIATKYLINEGRKVCIIDIDGHHGDGTERIFYSEQRVLFCSLHQEGAYPFSSGKITGIGSGKGGRGLNINLVVPKHSGDDILMRCLHFIKPYSRRFKPDIIGISAGFDGYREDRLLDLNYSITGYYEAGKEISSWGYPVFAVLEGGYHAKVVECIEAFVSGVNFATFSGEEATSSNRSLHKIVESNIETFLNNLQPNRRYGEL